MTSAIIQTPSKNSMEVEELVMKFPFLFNSDKTVEAKSEGFNWKYWTTIKRNRISSRNIAMACDTTSLLQKYGCGRRKLDDPFFSSGDKICSMLHREGIIDFELEGFAIDKEEKKRFPCSIPTCHKVSSSPAEFEAHFNSCHRFICAQCRKSLPSAHFLDLHLSEVHSTFFQVQAERTPMYKCFVEACDVLSSTPKERHNHCINFHKFPHDYRFDKGTSKSVRSESKAKKNNNQKKQNEDPREQITSNAAKSAPSFSFGHAAAHGNVFIPRSLSVGKSMKKKKEGKESQIKLDELMDTLPPV